MTTTPAASSRSRLAPEPLPRRDFLGLAALWSAAATLLFALFGALRLPRAAVVPMASRKFRVTLPETLAPGAAFLPPGRSVAVFRDAGGVFAVSRVCTHLGCAPLYRPEVGAPDLGSDWPGGFFCPCHGSRFDLAGRVFAGVPAPLNLAVPPYRFVGESTLVIGDESGAGA